MLAWHIQKLLDKPKRFIQRCCPNRRGKKTTTKTSNQPCDQPDDTIPSMVQTASTSTHPKTEQTVTNQPNKKSLAHYRVLTQHTHTQTHPTNRACPKQLAEPYTHPHHKPNRSKCGSSERNHQRSFSYRHLTTTRLNQTVWRGVVGHADSHKATHTHTTTQIARSGGKNRR